MKRKSFENNEFQVLVIKLFAADSQILLTTKVFIEFRPTSSSDDLDTTFILKIQIETGCEKLFLPPLIYKIFNSETHPLFPNCIYTQKSFST